ncbi:unnamed protein product, partial [Ectocarpus sp. 13 AM-2016]
SVIEFLFCKLRPCDRADDRWASPTFFLATVGRYICCMHVGSRSQRVADPLCKSNPVEWGWMSWVCVQILSTRGGWTYGRHRHDLALGRTADTFVTGKAAR